MSALANLKLGRDRRPRSPKRATALEVDGNTLRVAQAENGSQVELVATAALELPADADRNDPVIVGAAVGRALAKLRLKPSSVVMGVPRARVVLRNLTLPVVDKLPELASMIHLQVGKDLPFRIDEAVVDFQTGAIIRPPDAKAEKADQDAAPAAAPRLQVLVAIVKRDVLEFYQRMAEAAGAKLAALGLLPQGIARCIEACRVAEPGTAAAIISLRTDEVSVEIVAREALMFSRGATIRGEADGDRVEQSKTIPVNSFVPAAVLEIVRSLHGYGGTEPDNPVGKVVVAGATGHESAVAEALGSQLKAPCSVLHLAEALALPAEFQEAAAGSIGAVGLALSFSDAAGLPFDFLNPKRPAVQRNMKRIRLLAAAALVAVLFATVLGMRAWLIGKRSLTLTAASVELADAEKKRPAYRKVIAQSAVVDNWVKSGRNWLEHYAYLASVLPPSEDIYLSGISVNGQGVIRLGVQARSGEILARLDKMLRTAGYDVKPLAITPGADRFGYEFRSTVEIISSDKLKIDLQKAQPPARLPDDASLDPKAWKRGGG